MNIRLGFTMALTALVMTAFTPVLSAEEVCKWVDEEGTVHYDTTCPEAVDSETLEVSVEDPVPSETDPYAATRERMAEQNRSKQAESAPVHNAPAATDFSNMSPAQLSRECERQREARLGPERDKLIAECKAAGDKSASHCERFYADWGNGGRQGGHTVPRRYDNLPVCVAAREGGR